jgi:hypothetical protein
MTAGEHWFSRDRVLVYAAFCADFGPMNLAAGLLAMFYFLCSLMLCFVARTWVWLLVLVVLCFFFFVRADFGLMDLAAGLHLLRSLSCAMATPSAFCLFFIREKLRNELAVGSLFLSVETFAPTPHPRTYFK